MGTVNTAYALPFLDGEYEDFGQDAFNRYALEIGELVMDDIGLFMHGSGYEW